MSGDHHEPLLLIVEPDVAVIARVRQAVRRDATVVSCQEFPDARMRVLYDPPEVLVTNLRLAEYNGLHLVILARTAETVSRCIVHTNAPDLLLIREAQSFGAFYERTDRLPFALPSYLHMREWPSSDRRDPGRVDRRNMFRGGRRSSDVAEITAATLV
jgi:DNA-binding NtrC family response regulator